MSITREPNAYFVCIILHKCMPTIFMFLCAYSSWIRLGSVYFQIMSLEIARSSCFQRRWKKLHPWATLVGNGLLKTTNKCLACATRWECKREHERSHKKCVCMWEPAVKKLNAGVWWYDNELNSDPLCWSEPDFTGCSVFLGVWKLNTRPFRTLRTFPCAGPYLVCFCLLLSASTPL